MINGAMSNAYVMGSGEAELERLARQAHLFEQQSRALLDRTSLHTGMRALDIGCGPVGILDLLAEVVGPEGEVLGIDSNSEMVATATRFAAARGLDRVRVEVADARATRLASDQFDLVHARLVLLHAADPQALVAEMVRVCRPGGVVAVHDVDSESWYCEPSHPAWPRLAEAFLHILAARGTWRPHLGRSLYGILRHAGLENVDVTAFPELWRSDDYYREKLIIFVESVRTQIVDRGLVSEPELDQLIAELRLHLANPNTIVFGGVHFQAWGWKPQR